MAEIARWFTTLLVIVAIGDEVSGPIHEEVFFDTAEGFLFGLAVAAWSVVAWRLIREEA